MRSTRTHAGVDCRFERSRRNDEKTCSLCLETLGDGAGLVALIPCGHVFHGTCCRRWRAHGDAARRANGESRWPPCPTCRRASQGGLKLYATLGGEDASQQRPRDDTDAVDVESELSVACALRDELEKRLAREVEAKSAVEAELERERTSKGALRRELHHERDARVSSETKLREVEAELVRIEHARAENERRVERLEHEVVMGPLMRSYQAAPRLEAFTADLAEIERSLADATPQSVFRRMVCRLGALHEASERARIASQLDIARLESRLRHANEDTAVPREAHEEERRPTLKRILPRPPPSTQFVPFGADGDVVVVVPSTVSVKSSGRSSLATTTAKRTAPTKLDADPLEIERRLKRFAQQRAAHRGS